MVLWHENIMSCMMSILAWPAHNIWPYTIAQLGLCKYSDTTQRKLGSQHLAVSTGLLRVFWTDCHAVIDMQHQRFSGCTHTAS